MTIYGSSDSDRDADIDKYLENTKSNDNSGGFAHDGSGNEDIADFLCFFEGAGSRTSVVSFDRIPRTVGP